MSALEEQARSVPCVPPDELGPQLFRSIFARHPCGVAVVTASHGGTPFGFTATSVVSVSAEPPLLAFSVDTSSRAWTVLRSVRTLAINFLSRDQADLSVQFARRGADRFSGAAWSRLTTGEPVLEGVTAWLRAGVEQAVPAGSSRVMILRALGAHRDARREPLVYAERSYHRLAPVDAS